MKAIPNKVYENVTFNGKKMSSDAILPHGLNSSYVYRANVSET